MKNKEKEHSWNSYMDNMESIKTQVICRSKPTLLAKLYQKYGSEYERYVNRVSSIEEFENGIIVRADYTVVLDLPAYKYPKDLQMQIARNEVFLSSLHKELTEDKGVITGPDSIWECHKFTDWFYPFKHPTRSFAHVNLNYLLPFLIPSTM